MLIYPANTQISFQEIFAWHSVGDQSKNSEQTAGMQSCRKCYAPAQIYFNEMQLDFYKYRLSRFSFLFIVNHRRIHILNKQLPQMASFPSIWNKK